VNNAERRVHEIEERLERFEAPEPPAGLIASIQAEIPGELGAVDSAPGPGRRNWYRLAASLAVLTVGGMLGYRLLHEGPQPGETVPGDQSAGARLSGAELSPPPAELGERVSAAPEPSPSGAVGRVPQPAEPPGDGGGSEDADKRAVASAEHRAGEPTPEGRADSSVKSPEARREIGLRDAGSALVTEREQVEPEGYRPTAESPAGQVPRPEGPGEAIAGGNQSGDRLDLADGPAGALSGERDGRSVETLRSEQEALEKQLESLPAAEPLIVTSESPPLDQVAEVMPTPRAKKAPQAVMGDEAPRGPIAWRRSEVRQEMKTRGRPSSAPSTGGTAEPNDQAYGDMFFQTYGTNPFIDTEDDPQSTFGIDVDTASYTLARSYLERGSLPPADAIRVEEFVNYFDYHDPAPRSHDFAVVAEGAPSPFASTARTYLLRFALKGREIAASQRQAAVLTFVVDVSGSMNRDDRLGLVKRALRLLVGELDSGDAIGLVVYGSRGQVVLEPTSDHGQVLAAIENLQPGGSTNAEEGLMLGYRTARRYFRRGAINRLILCSDGVANVGNTGPESILDRIGKEAKQGIELTTVGFGMGNYNDVLMEQLADKGDGNYAYVDDLAAARRVFVENLTGTLETIAGDAKIQVEFDPRVVQSYRLLGYENRDIADRDFRNDAVDAGEIGAGHQVTALYEVKLRPEAPAGREVATLRLRYRSRRSGQIVEDAVELRQSDLASSWRRASHGLQLAAVAAEFAEVLKGSHWARESSLDALAARARELAASGFWDSEQAELADLIARAARLRQGAPVEGEDGIER
jgi:Ca-activated chloride channel family protein